MHTAIYADRKSSGSAWLGEIPAHWGVKKLKFLATVQPSNVDKKFVEGEVPVILCNYTDVYKNEFIDGSLDFMQASATEAEIKKFKVDVGDVIVTKDSESPEDIAVPACIAEQVEGLVCGYHLTQIKPIDLEGRYLFRLFQSKGFNAQFIVAANGVTRFGLPQFAIANAVSPLPPLEEQKTIAHFLDYKTAQIDALIAKQKTLLDKLAEKRTALISHAVTKGLDPTVPMKASGVEWLGEIPAHWKTIALHYVGRLRSGESITALQFSEDGEYPVFGGNGYRGKCDRFTHQGEYVLIGRQGALCGNINTARGKFFASEHAIVVNSVWEFQTDWMAYQLTVMDLNQYSVSAAQPGLSAEVIGRLKISFPTIDEQKNIANFLNKESEKIQTQRKKIEDVIVKLQEYRSALITNAVTGKIDVRGFQIPQVDDVITSSVEVG